jgi:hypothetical protein
MLGLFLVAPRERRSRNALAETILFPLMGIFMLPASMLPFQGRDASPFGSSLRQPQFPSHSAALYGRYVCRLFGLWLVASSVIARVRSLFASVGLLVRCSLSFLLPGPSFGPLSGFAGDLMFGILNAGRHMDGQYLFSPLRLTISGVLWALSLVAAYRLIFVPPYRVSPAKA